MCESVGYSSGRAARTCTLLPALLCERAADLLAGARRVCGVAEARFWLAELGSLVCYSTLGVFSSRVVLQPLNGRDALNSIQATPKTQSPLVVAAGFHRAMAAATGNQVSGGSPRPRLRPPEISTCGGLSRPGRRRRAARHLYTGCSLYGRPSPCLLSRESRPRAVACSRGLLSARVALVPYDAAITGRAVRDRRLQSARVGLAGSLRQRRHGFAPALHRAAYCLRASPLPQATPRTRGARSATAGCDKLLSVDLEGRC